MDHQGLARQAVARRAVLLVNSGARTGQEAFDAAREQLTRLGLPLVAAHAIEDPSTLPGIVDRAVAAGERLIVVGGGDGTVRLVASRLAGTGVVLAVLPLGTANDLARTLGLRTDLAGACDTVLNGRPVAVDLGTIGDDYFLNVASVGLAVGVTRNLSPRLKKRLGALAYPIAGIRAYWEHEPFDARLEFPDGDHEPIDLRDLLQLAVANGRFYGGGAVAAPDAGIDDHLLDVYAIPRGTAWQRWQVARHFVSGAFTERDHVLHLTTRAVRLVTDPPMGINADGEIQQRTPQLFGVRSGALTVLVPQ